MWYDMSNPENDVFEGFFSVKEFARHLGVHANTVRRAIKNGRLSAVRLGKGKKAIYRIAKSEVNRLAVVDLKDYIDKIIEERLKKKVK